jgi:catechol 2,3-dioxygenase-like lactoylglutathione lyase family enzyme
VITGFHHLTLNVTDLDRSRRFYQALPGFVIDQDFPVTRCASASASRPPGWC